MTRYPFQVVFAIILLSLLAVNVLNAIADTLLYRPIQISERENHVSQ